ncbi:alpha-tectorin-like isoform X2 [Engystomops pustulosus]|uniref:alpha-tectorin-like isoform X2 n=1 Tax=Engystomops pustulosus TaxID=76066 RepID=UPI003AFA2486
MRSLWISQLWILGAVFYDAGGKSLSDPCKRESCHTMETCEVQDGKAVCVPNFTGQCWEGEDSQFHTLDEYDFSFQGNGSYILSQYTGSDLTPYKIVIKNDNRNTQDGSLARKVEMTTYDTKISVEGGEFPKIQVNNEMTKLPVSLAESKITIKSRGWEIIIATDFDLKIIYDLKFKPALSLPSTYSNSVSGLCGNFNQNPIDDQKSPEGKMMDSAVAWADSWKVSDHDPFCSDVCPCTCPFSEESKKKLDERNDNCGKLFKKDGPFRDCISKVCPNKFFDGCLYDTCRNDGDKVILCQALEAYADTCISRGIKIYDWRTSSDCQNVPEDPPTAIKINITEILKGGRK